MPCSTGEEPYSIAIWLLENWRLVDDYEIEIVGSDIDTGVLEQARDGIYGKRALMRLSPYLVEKYFVAAGAESWKILDGLRQSVRFTRANIVNPDETRPHGQFDVIFCRNVAIYFSPAARATLFRGLEQWPELLTDPRSLRDAYLAEIETFLQEMQTCCRGMNIDYLRLTTDQSLGIALSSYLAHRQARG